MNEDNTPHAPAIFSAVEAASYLRLAPATLSKWRVRGGGPEYLKLGRRVVYRMSDLNEWLDAHRRTSTSGQGQRGA